MLANVEKVMERPLQCYQSKSIELKLSESMTGYNRAEDRVLSIGNYQKSFFTTKGIFHVIPIVNIMFM